MVERAVRSRSAPRSSQKRPQAAAGGVSVWEIARPLLKLCLSVPWDQLGEERRPPPARPATPKAESLPVHGPPAPPAPPALPATRPTLSGGPGCQAADACLLVHGYLTNLAEGKSGFGVLRIAKDRMEEGAVGAARMGQLQLAEEMRKVAQELPTVKSPEAAAALAPRLKELSNQTWDLGRRCGGHNVSPQLFGQAQGLAARMRDGEIPPEKAVAELRESIVRETS